MNGEYIEEGCKKLLSLLLGLAVAAAVTLVFISILAFVMLRTEMAAEFSSAGAIVISVLSCFAGGFVCGKKNRKKRFLWGLGCGLLYFFVLMIIRLAGGEENGETAVSLVTSFLYCAGSGMLGGMLS